VIRCNTCNGPTALVALNAGRRDVDLDSGLLYADTFSPLFFGLSVQIGHRRALPHMSRHSVSRRKRVSTAQSEHADGMNSRREPQPLLEVMLPEGDLQKEPFSKGSRS